jgi:hypothetical protein
MMKFHRAIQLRPAVLVMAFILLCQAFPASAQTTRPATQPGEVTQAYLREFYTKYEYIIPMRDGVKLYVAVFAPKDQARRYPILLTRTPYGVKPYGEVCIPIRHSR